MKKHLRCKGGIALRCSEGVRKHTNPIMEEITEIFATENVFCGDNISRSCDNVNSIEYSIELVEITFETIHLFHVCGYESRCDVDLVHVLDGYAAPVCNFSSETSSDALDEMTVFQKTREPHAGGVEEGMQDVYRVVSKSVFRE